MADSFDIAVIGAGPGGYVAAIRAAQLGLKTVVIERENLGGICLNWGCIPTKALLRSAEVYHNARHASDYGLVIPQVDFDLAAIVKRSRAISKQLNMGVGHLLKKNKVTVLYGEASIPAKGQVKVKEKDGEKTLDAKNIIIATGARPRELPHLKADGKNIWNYRHAMVPETLPKTLLVVGSGAIGIEFASFYADLGVKVTVVEVADRIVPVEDAEISAFLETAMKKRGLDIRTSATVASLKDKGNAVTAELERNGVRTPEDFGKVILAIGISPNTENLGLEALGVQLDRGHIATDGHCRTNLPGIYAIGDVAGAPWLAHKASHEGVIAAETIAGHKVHPMDKANIPGCTYCRPQVASVGLTEAAAKAKGHTVRTGKFPFIGNGKAIALGEPEGFIKTVFDEKTGALLGAHMIGAEVTELIQGYAIARTLETTEAELMHTVFPHPTLSEMMHESVLDAFGRALHV